MQKKKNHTKKSSQAETRQRKRRARISFWASPARGDAALATSVAIVIVIARDSKRLASETFLSDSFLSTFGAPSARFRAIESRGKARAPPPWRETRRPFLFSDNADPFPRCIVSSVTRDIVYSFGTCDILARVPVLPNCSASFSVLSLFFLSEVIRRSQKMKFPPLRIGSRVSQ